MLHVLQLGDQSLLRRTTRAGIPFNRPLIDHDRKCKSRMSFCLCHHEFGCLIDAIVRAVPIDNYAINAAADHVGDLAMDLVRIRRTIAHIHVVRAAEPQQQMGINLGSRAGI